MTATILNSNQQTAAGRFTRQYCCRVQLSCQPTRVSSDSEDKSEERLACPGHSGHLNHRFYAKLFIYVMACLRN